MQVSVQQITPRTITPRTITPLTVVLYFALGICWLPLCICFCLRRYCTYGAEERDTLLEHIDQNHAEELPHACPFPGYGLMFVPAHCPGLQYSYLATVLGYHTHAYPQFWVTMSIPAHSPGWLRSFLPTIFSFNILTSVRSWVTTLTPAHCPELQYS